MRPTLRQLEALLAVAECRSFSAAARQLRVSQPAITRTISDLELSAGVKLFERAAAGVIVTSYGDSLLRHARTILSEVQHASRELAAMRGAASGRVAVGTTPAGAAWIVPSAVERFSRSTPDAGVSVMEMSLPLMLGGLRAGDLDLVIAPIANDESLIEFAAEELYRDQLCAVVSSSHPAAGARRLDLEALFEYPWIIPPVRTRAGTLVRAMFRRNQLDLPSSHLETQAINVVRELLLAGTIPWIAALPSDIFRQDQRQGRIDTITLPQGGHLRPIGMLQRARAPRSPLVNAFVACLRAAAASDKPTVATAAVAPKSRRRATTSASS